MSIRMTCPQCQQKFKVKDEFSGRRGKCPACGATVRVPGEKMRTQPGAETAGAPAAPPAATPAELPAPPSTRAEASPFAFDPGAPTSAEDNAELTARPKKKPTMPAQPTLPEPATGAGSPFAFDAAAPARPEPPPKPKSKMPTTTIHPSLPESAPAASDSPFAFEAAGTPETAPKPATKAPEPPPPATEGSSPFGFTAAAPADKKEPPEPRRRNRSAGRSERRRDDVDAADEPEELAELEADEAPRARPPAREGTWADVAAGCQWVRIGAIVVGSAALAAVILPLVAIQSAYTFWLLALIAATVGYVFGVLGRKSARLAPDPVVRDHSNVSLILSLVTAGLLALSTLLNLLLVSGVGGGGLLSILQITTTGAFVCGALAEVFFARALMRISAEVRYPTLKSWGQTILIGSAAVGGTYALGFLISLLSSAGGSLGGAGVGFQFMRLAQVAVVVFAVLYNIPLIQSTGLLLGTWKPEQRPSRRRVRGGDDRDFEDEPEPAADEAPKAAERAEPPPASEEPFAFGDEPDDRDDDRRKRPRRR